MAPWPLAIEKVIEGCHALNVSRAQLQSLGDELNHFLVDPIFIGLLAEVEHGDACRHLVGITREDVFELFFLFRAQSECHRSIQAAGLQAKVPGKATGEANRSDPLLGVSRVQGYCVFATEIRNQKEFHVVTVNPPRTRSYNWRRTGRRSPWALKEPSLTPPGGKRPPCSPRMGHWTEKSFTWLLSLCVTNVYSRPRPGAGREDY